MKTGNGCMGIKYTCPTADKQGVKSWILCSCRHRCLVAKQARWETPPHKKTTPNITPLLKQMCRCLHIITLAWTKRFFLLSFGSLNADFPACLLTPTQREGEGKKNQCNTAELSDHMKLWILGLSIQPLSAELCKSIQTDTKSKHTAQHHNRKLKRAEPPLFKICLYIFVLWITILKWNLNSYLK